MESYKALIYRDKSSMVFGLAKSRLIEDASDTFWRWEVQHRNVRAFRSIKYANKASCKRAFIRHMENLNLDITLEK